MKDKLVKVDVLDVLLDKDNTSPIVLKEKNGKSISFKQIAVIPHEVKGEYLLFAVLEPMTKIEGIGDNEALVFRVVQNKEGGSRIVVEEDEMVAIAVFNKYYDMLEDSMKETPAGKKKPKK